MQGVANGTGPNPAQAALAQATGANTANQAALMAGQRGTGANAGLLARQAAMQGGANQQAAAGQGAAMQAQQSLNALGQMGGMANQQAGQQANALNAYNQAAQGQQSNILNAIGNQNSANVGMQSNMNNANAGIAQGNAGRAQDTGMGILKGISGIAGLKLAHGGSVPAEPFHWESHLAGGYAYGGVTAPAPVAAALMPIDNGATAPNGDAEALGKNLGEGAGKLIGSLGDKGTKLAGGPMDLGSIASIGMMASQGGKVPAIVSPGEAYLAPDKVNKVAQGGSVEKNAEKIPGKAKVKGDSTKNDTVPKELEPGGIVIPRSVMQSENPALEAHKFVAAILSRQNLKKKS